MSRDTVVRSLYKFIYYASAQGALSDDAVWRLSVWGLRLSDVWRLSHTSGRRAACVAGRLDSAYWLIGPGSAGLARGCPCALPLQAWAGAYRDGRPPTACWFCLLSSSSDWFGFMCFCGLLVYTLLFSCMCVWRINKDYLLTYFIIMFINQKGLMTTHIA